LDRFAGREKTVAVSKDNAGIAVPMCESEQFEVFQYLNGHIPTKTRGIPKRPSSTSDK